MGLLLVGHGTRCLDGQKQFLQLAEWMRLLWGAAPLEAAFLELAAPTIETAIQKLLLQNVQSIVVAPLLLFAAGHAKADIPAAVAQSLAPRRDVRILQAEHLGCHPLLLELAASRLRQAVGDRAQSHEKTCLLVVGRGSHDSAATAEFWRFTQLLAQRTGYSRFQGAFLAMAQPAVQAVIEDLGTSAYQRIVVYPHLLFDGELSETIRDLVRPMADRRNDQNWILAPLLADPVDYAGEGRRLLPQILVEKALEAAAGYSPRFNV